MSDSINNKAKEYYDNDDTGGSLNSNLKDFLKQQGAEGNSLNTLWRNYAYGEGGNSLNTRLGKLWGTSGSLVSRWKEVLGLTWDDLKLFFNARRNDPELLLSGATSFDGSDDYIDCGDIDIGTNALSVSAWIYVNTAETDRGLISKDYSGERCFLLHTGSSEPDELSWIVFEDDSTYIWKVTTGDNFTAKTWHHVVATSNGIGTMAIYIDGVSQTLTSSGSGNGTIQNTTSKVIIGASGNGTYKYFDGSIANVGIWNRALSSSEIESIYWKGQYADLKNTELTNLVSWYNLSADANDSTGTNNGTNNGATTLTDAYSASSPFLPRIQDKASDTVANYGEVYGGNAVSFDGVNDYINLVNSVEWQKPKSISMWFKATSISSHGSSVYIKDTLIGYGNIWWAVQLDVNKKIQYYFYDGSARSWLTDSTITLSKWHHIAVVSGGNSSQIFLDGQSIGSNSLTWDDNTSGTSEQLKLGGAGGYSTQPFTGSMSHVQIFSEALTQDQVRELYTKPELTLPTGIASSALKLDMPMQEGSGTAILDGSGNQNHGTGDGITWANGQEYGFQHPLVRSNNPMVFDGSNDYIDTGNAFNHTNHTISAWLNANVTTGNDRIIFDARDSGSDGILLYVRGDNNKIGYQLNSTALTTSLAYDAQDIHVVASYDGSTQKTYINGSLVASQSTSLTTSTTTNAVIGARNFSSQASFFGGRINEVSVWDSALTDNEVTALYNSGLPLLPTTDSGNYASADDLVGYWRNDGVTTWTDRTPTDDPELVTNGNYSGWSVESGDAFTIESNGTLTVANTSTTSTIEYSFEVVQGRTYRWNTTFSSQSGTGLLYYIKQPNAGFVSFSSYIWSLTNYDFVATTTGTASVRLAKYGGHNGNGVMATASIIRERGGNNGTVSGSPASIIVPEGLNEGRDSQGYYLTDTDSISSGIRLKGAEYISVQDSESLSFGNGTSDSPFSLEAWVKMEEVSDFQIFNKGTYNSDGEYRFECNGSDKLSLLLFDESGASTFEKAITTATMPENTWIHVCATYNGVGGASANGGITLYLNGVSKGLSLDGNGTYVAMENLGANVQIGKHSSTYSKGSIDEAKVYSKELSATEVLKNYNNGKSAHSN